MKYIPIETCGECPHHAHEIDADITVGICYESGKPIQDHVIAEHCPLPSLPEWRLLAEGEAIQEGDDVLDLHDDSDPTGPIPWVPVIGTVGRPYNSRDMAPMRRRQGGEGC
jgi:hypothetical protein